MYYQNYEDYMRSVLSYPLEAQNTYEPYNFPAMQYESPVYDTSENYRSELMDLYPDIYKLVNPMVCKICEANTKPVTRELVDQMTDEIYLNIENAPEIDTIINVRVNAERGINDTREPSSNKSSKSIASSNRHDLKATSISENREKEIQESRDDRQRRPRNRTLQDLIRILILNQLLGIHRPPRPPHRPRPPFPGPGPMPRPPFHRDDIYSNNYLNF